MFILGLSSRSWGLIEWLWPSLILHSVPYDSTQDSFILIFSESRSADWHFSKNPTELSKNLALTLSTHYLYSMKTVLQVLLTSPPSHCCTSSTNSLTSKSFPLPSATLADLNYSISTLVQMLLHQLFQHAPLN